LLACGSDSMKRLEKKGTTVVREMRTKVVGVSMEGRQAFVQQLVPGQVLVLCNEEENPFDVNALKLFADQECAKPIGYIAREIASDIMMQARKFGYSYEVRVQAVTGGNGRTYGVNIVITAYK